MDSHLKVIYKFAKVLQYFLIGLIVLSSFIIIYGLAVAQMMMGIITTLVAMGIYTVIQIFILRGIKKQIIKLENNEQLSYVIPVVLFVLSISTLLIGFLYIYLIYLVYRYNRNFKLNN